MKEKIRIAEIRGSGIKKRCRKPDYIYVDGIGKTDEEALANLKANIQKTIADMRLYEFKDEIHIYDATRDFWNGHSSICRPMMAYAHPTDTNCVTLSWTELQKGAVCV